MLIDEVFALNQPGKVVVVGVVADGEVKPGERLSLRATGDDVRVTVEAIEANHKPLQVASRGDRVGIMLAGAEKAQVGHGAVLASAGVAADGEPSAAPAPARDLRS
jgi:selenocysteine-specific elongation factor